MNKLILLRHGQSQWNLENKFTGWQNVPLTKKGELEAKKAGELIKKNKIHIDYVFSSVLERANKTAEIALKEAELKNLWDNDKLLMTCNENLNERDYGDLVGLNKQETAEKFGLGNKVLGEFFPNEKKGLVPSTSWKKKNFRPKLVFRRNFNYRNWTRLFSIYSFTIVFDDGSVS